jgi:hypothetical protein
MDEYDQVQEFKARFEALKRTAENLLGATALTCARMYDFDDDDICVFVGHELADINERIAAIVEELHDLEAQLY